MAKVICVTVHDLKQKLKFSPDIGTYVSEEDIDLMERVVVDDGNIRSHSVNNHKSHDNKVEVK